MPDFRFFRKLTSTTWQQQACQVKKSEKGTSIMFDKVRSKEQMTVPTMIDLWWLFSYLCFVYSCCHFEQSQPWVEFVHAVLFQVFACCGRAGLCHEWHFPAHLFFLCWDGETPWCWWNRQQICIWGRSSKMMLSCRCSKSFWGQTWLFYIHLTD